MDRSILNKYKNPEEKLILSKILDKISFCISKNQIQVSDFLNLAEQDLIIKFLKLQREERINREKEQREKMLANSPAKKNRGAKKRTEREAKKQAYRQKLIAMGKKSLGELDEELTDLQGKEQQAKKLCEQYEQQLPDQSHQEI